MLLHFLIFSVISLIVKLPCIWIALAAPKSKLPWQAIGWCFCAGLFGLLELIIFVVSFGDLGSNLDQFFFALTLGHSAMAATMIAVLYVLRSFGYRMSRIDKTPPELNAQPRS